MKRGVRMRWIMTRKSEDMKNYKKLQRPNVRHKMKLKGMRSKEGNIEDYKSVEEEKMPKNLRESIIVAIKKKGDPKNV